MTQSGRRLINPGGRFVLCLDDLGWPRVGSMAHNTLLRNHNSDLRNEEEGSQTKPKATQCSKCYSDTSDVLTSRTGSIFRIMQKTRWVRLKLRRKSIM